MKNINKIKKIIKKSNNLFIVAHKNLDLDAIGACVGLATIGTHFHKNNYIIIDDEKHEPGVEKIIKQINNDFNIISSKDIPIYHQKNSTLLITDTNKASLLQNDRVVNYFDNIIIIDHHQETDQTISNALKIINEDSSSSCEIITGLIMKYKVKLNPIVATIILSGIILDTSNFTVKIKDKTYYAAYLLTNLGANPKLSQDFLKQDINDYLAQQRIITNVKIVKQKYAISIAPDKEMYKREELAKVADTLLRFNGIEASFVLGNRIDGGVGLSARSEGIINVGQIAEILGGGGDYHDAAAQIKNITLKEAEKVLLKELK